MKCSLRPSHAGMNNHRMCISSHAYVRLSSHSYRFFICAGVCSAVCFRRGDGCPLTSIVVHRGYNEPPAYGDSQLLYVYQEPLPPPPIPPQSAAPPPAAAAAGAAAAAAAAVAPPEPTPPQVAQRWSTFVTNSAQPLHLEAVSTFRGRRVTGKYDSHDGTVQGVLWRMDAVAAQSVALPVVPNAPPQPVAGVGCWAFEGTFAQSNYKRAGYCAFRWDADAGSFDGVWSYGEESGSWNGFRVAEETPPAPKVRLFTHDRKPLFALADGRLSCSEAIAHPPEWEHFVYTVLPGGGGAGADMEVGYLMTAHGKYVTADETGVVTATATARVTDDASTWYVETGENNVRACLHPSFRSALPSSLPATCINDYYGVVWCGAVWCVHRCARSVRCTATFCAAPAQATARSLRAPIAMGRR
jgi:hypothetical protein